jgi:hypothetical protein
VSSTLAGHDQALARQLSTGYGVDAQQQQQQQRHLLSIQQQASRVRRRKLKQMHVLGLEYIDKIHRQNTKRRTTVVSRA